MVVRLGVLGVLTAATGHPRPDTAVDLGGRRQRALLAMLLAARGEVVPVDRLVDALWRGDPAPGAVAALQVHVSRLRRCLEPDRPPRARASILRTDPAGYSIRLPEEAVDAWRFEALVARAAGRADGDQARTDLEQGLALWRGPAFAEVADEPWAQSEVARLDGLRAVARERLVAAMLASGRIAEADLVAASLTTEHPLREEGWRLLAVARYAAGRQADALAALQRARRHLMDELGLEPGPALRSLELDILSQRVAAEWTAPEPAFAPSRVGRGEPPWSPPAAGDGFVGRAAQLRALRSAAEHARRAAVTTVAVVTGDPGAGKSTLLQRLGDELSAGGWTVVTGRCPETDGAPPAWAWSQVARALADGVGPEGTPSALAPLLGDDLRGSGLDVSTGRFLLRQALEGMLTEAARRAPLALLLDDLHCADAETLDLLAVIKDVADLPFLVVTAARPLWPTAGEPDATGALAASSPVRVDLPGFDAAEAAELIAGITGASTDQGTLATLLERTGGNAFYLVESARLLASEGSVVATSRVPDGVRDVLRRRFALLGATTIDVLRLAAVIGRDVEVDLLLHVAALVDPVGLDEEQVVFALEAGVRAGLLVEPAPGEVRFAHAVVRETLSDDVPGVRRSRWHARVAAALAAIRPNDAAGLAHHLYRSGTAAGARAAIDAAVVASDQAMARYAPERAVELYDHALQALDRLAPEGREEAATAFAERVELLSRRSRAELAAGAGLAAVESRAAAVRAAERSGDRQLLARALAAWDLPTPWTVRAYGTVDAWLVGLLEGCLDGDELDARLRCLLLYTLVREVAGVTQDRAAAAALEAEALARSSGDETLLGLALHARGVVLLHDSDLAGRLPLAAELCAIGAQPGLATFALIGHEFVVQWAAAHAEVATLAEQVERLEALVETYRWRQGAGVLATHHAVLAHLTGDLDAADVHYRSAAQVLRRNGGLDADWIHLIGAFSVAVTRGRAGELAPLLDALRPIPPAAADLAAVVFAAAGDRAAAEAARGSCAPIGHDFFRSLRLTVRALAVVELALVDEAADAYDQLRQFEGQLGGAVTGAYAFLPVDLLLGDLATLLGRSATARRHYAAAAVVAARSGSAPWIAAVGDRRAR